MSLINSKLCKLEINYALFFSIISGNTIIVGEGIQYKKGADRSVFWMPLTTGASLKLLEEGII